MDEIDILPTSERCGKPGCFKAKAPRQKYCCKAHAPYAHLEGDTPPRVQKRKKKRNKSASDNKEVESEAPLEQEYETQYYKLQS